MAVEIEFINLVVPRKRVEQIYPNGWSGCLADYATSIGKICWYDDHLFRTGVMDSDMIDAIIDKWVRLGFVATDVVDGETSWRDICVFTSFGGTQYACPWLIVDAARRAAWLRGTEPGQVVGRDVLSKIQC